MSSLQALSNGIVDSLESIELHNVQAKLSPRAEPSLIDRGGNKGCRHQSLTDSRSKEFVVSVSKENRTKLVRGSGRSHKIRLFRSPQGKNHLLFIKRKHKIIHLLIKSWDV